MRITRLHLLVAVATISGATGCGTDDDPAEAEVTVAIVNPPADAIFAPADYDGDGWMDVAFKGGNVWYIDIAKCSVPGQPETNCADYVDNDLDGFINDGCPPVGSRPEVTDPALGRYECDAPYQTGEDEDLDLVMNDGCPTNTQCLGPDAFGGRWDFAYAGYGDNTAIPIPADYGTINNGPADGRADLAIRDASGMFAIDYADNGFGTFDEIHFGYGTAPPWVGDFDGDGRADLSVRTIDGAGYWYFDYSSNGFGGWDVPCTTGCPCTVTAGGGPVGGYGNDLATPAIGDFNGDSCDDLSVKDQFGNWFFDFSGDGFGWQSPCPGCPVPLPFYGNNTAKPIVANYDPDFDDKADLAVHTADGYWAIDFAADGFGAWNTPWYGAGWGSSVAKLVPGHYTTTSGNLDQGIGSIYGYWHIDRASPGYGGWDMTFNTTPALVDKTHAYIDDVVLTQPTVPPGPTSGNFSEVPVDESTLEVGVRYTANVHIDPGTECMSNLDEDFDGFVNDGCTVVGAAETGAACSNAVDNDGDGFVNDGCPVVADASESTPDEASVRVNPDVRVPASLNLEDVGGHTVQNTTSAIVYPHFRRFGFTCTEVGTFPLGFMLSKVHYATALNADYGYGVTCTAQHPGIYGWVTNKLTGAPIPNAIITVDNLNPFPANGQGFWNVAGLTGGPHKIVISSPSNPATFAPVEIINISVPAWGNPAGIRADAALEPSFVLQNGITYKTYIDYSRGRSIFHVVTVDVTKAPITLGKVPQQSGDFQKLLDVATAQGAPVMTNGIWWTLTGEDANLETVIGTQTCEKLDGPSFADTRSIGYLYINGFVGPGACAGGVCRPSDVECGLGQMRSDPVAPSTPGFIQNPWESPMFGVKGTGTNRRAEIKMTPTDFMSSGAPWKRIASVPNCPAGNVCPIYDAASPLNQSDYQYAFQMGFPLLYQGKVIARGSHVKIGSGPPGEFAYARTTLGVNAAGTRAWIVIADGEGIDGGNGATPHQLGVFYRDVLQASAAMIVDSGESTELILRGTGGPRRVNTLSSENNAADGIGPNGDFAPSGRVFSYIKAGT